MNKRMHIRGIHIVFSPCGGRQYDIGVQAGARQAEVQRHHQIQFAVLRCHATHFPGFTPPCLLPDPAP